MFIGSEEMVNFEEKISRQQQKHEKFRDISLVNLRRYGLRFRRVEVGLFFLLRSAVAGRLYKHHSKHTSNSGFDRSFILSSGYILFAAEQRVGYQISWVDLQREVNYP